MLQDAFLPERLAHRQALLEALLGHLDEVALQGVVGGHREAWRDGLAGDGEEGHPLRDLQGALQVLRVPREDLSHFLGGLHEELVRGEAHALLLGLGGLGANAEERVVEVGVLVVEVVGVVGGHEGNPQAGRELLLEGDDLVLPLEALVLDLQEEVVAKDVAELASHLLGPIGAVLQQAGLHLAAQAGREGDEALAVLAQEVLVHPGLVVEALGEARRDEAGQVGEAHGILGQQHQVVARVPGAAGVLAVFQALLAGGAAGLELAVEAGLGGHIDLAAQDGLHRPVATAVLRLLARIVELHHAEHVAVVRDGNCGHAGGLALLDQVRDAGQAVQERVLGVQVQVREAHAPFSAGWAPGGQVFRPQCRAPPNPIPDPSVAALAPDLRGPVRPLWPNRLCWTTDRTMGGPC